MELMGQGLVLMIAGMGIVYAFLYVRRGRFSRQSPPPARQLPHPCREPCCG